MSTPREAALSDAVQKIISAEPGSRNNTLFGQMCRINEYVANGHLDLEMARSTLAEAALSTGLSADEVDRVLRRLDGLEGPGSGVASLPAPTLVQAVPLPVVDVASDELVRWTAFVSARGPDAYDGDPHHTTWHELAHAADHPSDVPPGGKDALPLITFTELPGDTRRKGTQAIRIHALALDYDDDPDFAEETVARWWGDVDYVAHTSTNHGRVKGDRPAFPRGRVLVRLSRPVERAEWRLLAQWVLLAGKGRMGAKELRNTKCLFYIPAVRPDEDCEAEYAYWASSSILGRAIDVDKLLTQVRELPCLPHDTTPDGRPYIVAVGSKMLVAEPQGGYSPPIPEKILSVVLQRSWDVPTWVPKADGKGNRKMDVNEMFSRYGDVAKGFVYAYNAPSGYDYVSREATQGLFHQLVARPEYDPLCEEYLQRFCDDERLLDWIATVHVLDWPTAMLLLEGEHSLGKSMVADALGGLFGQGITDLEVVLSRFNDPLLRNPIVWGDEGMMAPANSGVLRKLVANHKHSVEPKGMPAGTLRGCPRFVVSTQSDDPLLLAEQNLNPADTRAIGERTMVLQCNEAVRPWLGRLDTSDWVTEKGTPGRLVRHFAWLVATRPVMGVKDENGKIDRTKRFLLKGDAKRWASQKLARAGLGGTVIEVLRDYIEDNSGWGVSLDTYISPSKAINPNPPFLFADERFSGQVLVSLGNLRKRWRGLVGVDERVPTQTTFKRVLSRLAGRDGPVQRRAPNGKPVRFYPVNFERLINPAIVEEQHVD